MKDYTFSSDKNYGIYDLSNKYLGKKILSSGTYLVKPDTSICKEQPKQKLTVLTTFTANIISNVKGGICEKDSALLSINYVSDTYNWYRNDTVLSNKTSSLNTGISGNYKVSYLDANGCLSNSSIYFLNKLPKPKLILEPNNMVKICKGSEITIQAISDAKNYLWTKGETTSNIKVSEKGVYKVKNWFDLKCPIFDSVTVAYFDTKPILLSADTSFCIAELQPLNLYLPLGYKSYQANSIFSVNNVLQINELGTITIKVKDENNCEILGSIAIIDNCERFKIPNIFTPNGDGINDLFEIQNLRPNCELSIFNRWGSEVYKANNYNNNWKAEDITDGLYYYLLHDTYYKIKYKGWLQISR